MTTDARDWVRMALMAATVALEGTIHTALEAAENPMMVIYSLYAYIHSRCTVQNVIISLLHSSCICMLRFLCHFSKRRFFSHKTSLMDSTECSGPRLIWIV